ncbi:MAG: KilA-N domain-containing protein [Candidatus Neomarinimicrobiota bacterium]|nr:MAG: KilA-N domain-containing protein [Candidatus Neomarinimicrobiota bacterium]
MSKTKQITVKGSNISILEIDNRDFISLSDMVKSFEGKSALIEQWLRNKDTVEFLGIWEQINNPSFNSLEFEGIKNASGTNRFYLSAKKWINATNAIGLIAKAGRYGGTFAHKDIAFEFGSWLSAEFKLYLIKEFQRLKDDENDRLKLNWDLQRTISKINYHIHTDAIKAKLIPPKVNTKQKSLIYASEADILNVALFGQTAQEWRKSQTKIDGNIRDYATLEQLVVLSNLESINAIFINQGLSQQERLIQLNEIAISQLKTLLSHKSIKRIK